MLRPRRPRLVLKKVTDAARGEHCTIRHPEHCNGNSETVVAAHSNLDKPVGGKTDDLSVAFACSGCHDWYDRMRDPDRHVVWMRGHLETLRVLYEKGVIWVR